MLECVAKNEGWKFVQLFGTNCHKTLILPGLQPVVVMHTQVITCGNYLDKFTDLFSHQLSSNSHQQEENKNCCFLGVAGPHESQNHIIRFFFLQNVVSSILMESEDGVVIVQAFKLWLWVRKVVMYCYRL